MGAFIGRSLLNPPKRSITITLVILSKAQGNTDIALECVKRQSAVILGKKRFALGPT